MTMAWSATSATDATSRRNIRLLWPATLALFVLLWQFGQPLVPCAFDYPKEWSLPLARWIGTASQWLLNDASFGPVAALLPFLIVAIGLWEKAMITLYLCGISAMVALAIGIPIGIVGAEFAGLCRWVQMVIDTLQTLPSFVYLMPAVLLFQVGVFTAMLAVVAFAIVPAIRYTALGLRGVAPRLIEAGKAMGCTLWHVLTRIKLHLAVPEILPSVNQTILFALSMLVITALVGTRDLGQEVYIALTKADPGRDLAVAFIAIAADLLIHASAQNARRRFGLSETNE